MQESTTNTNEHQHVDANGTTLFGEGYLCCFTPRSASQTAPGHAAGHLPCWPTRLVRVGAQGIAFEHAARGKRTLNDPSARSVCFMFAEESLEEHSKQQHNKTTQRMTSDKTKPLSANLQPTVAMRDMGHLGLFFSKL